MKWQIGWRDAVPLGSYLTAGSAPTPVGLRILVTLPISRDQFIAGYLAPVGGA
jgi:hypothetical protein